MRGWVRDILPILPTDEEFPAAHAKARRGSLREDGLDGQSFFVSRRDIWYFWDGEDKTNELGG
jgi:hypothetical protein